MPIISTLALLMSCLTTEEEYLEYRMALLDQDGDGYVWDRFPQDGGDDCNDFNASINPGAEEVPYNGRDDDCNPDTVDDDLDDDGYPLEVDCNDLVADINPGAVEVRDDGVDQDCDGSDLVLGYSPGTEVAVDWGSLPTPPEFGRSDGSGSSGGGGGSTTWTELTQYTGRVVDTSYLLGEGEPVEVGIWRSEDIQGEEPPFSARPLGSFDGRWTAGGMNFSLSFELEAGTLETCEVYAITDTLGYGSSGAFLINAGDWMTDQTIYLGEDAPSCGEPSDHPKESNICGTISDDMGLLSVGQIVHVSVYDADYIDGMLPDDTTGLIALSDIPWSGNPTDFYVGTLLSDSVNVIMYGSVPLEDDDIDPDLWGYTEPFLWMAGSDVVDVDFSFTEVIW